jgi:hypothetical protein
LAGIAQLPSSAGAAAGGGAGAQIAALALNMTATEANALASTEFLRISRGVLGERRQVNVSSRIARRASAAFAARAVGVN